MSDSCIQSAEDWAVAQEEGPRSPPSGDGMGVPFVGWLVAQGWEGPFCQLRAEAQPQTRCLFKTHPLCLRLGLSQVDVPAT